MSKARHTYHLYTAVDGAVVGTAWTNDNLDKGYPSEEAEWPVVYGNREEAERIAGKSRIGVNGCLVDVFIDNERI